MRSIRHYVNNHGLAVTIVSGPDYAVDDEGWEHNAYTLKLTNADRGTEMTVPWMSGLGITRHPDERPEEVISSLVSDVWGYHNADGFEDWAGEYGYGLDSRTAERIWKEIGEQAEQFIAFIGDDTELELLALTYERE